MDDDHKEFLLTEGSRRAARHWRDTCWVFVTGLDVLTTTVVDVGATSGSGVELSDGIHPDPGGRSCLTLMPG
jgi:hypothetical protein